MRKNWFNSLKIEIVCLCDVQTLLDWQRQKYNFFCEFGKYNADEKLYLSEKKFIMFRLPIYFATIKWRTKNAENFEAQDKLTTLTYHHRRLGWKLIQIIRCNWVVLSICHPICLTVPAMDRKSIRRCCCCYWWTSLGYFYQVRSIGVNDNCCRRLHVRPQWLRNLYWDRMSFSFVRSMAPRIWCSCRWCQCPSYCGQFPTMST